MSDPHSILEKARYFVTELSVDGVKGNQEIGVMWERQPALFKHCPAHFFRYRFSEHDALAVLAQMRKITQLSERGSKPYYQLNVPSAGNLHPLELYVQIRGIKGILSGLYHVDILQEAIVLIEEIEDYGIESHLGLELRHSGMIFLLSSVYYRSYWKYGIRSWRYLFLDAGHQIAAMQLAASAFDQKLKALKIPDTGALNTQMGFENHEHIIAAFMIAEPRTRVCKEFPKPLPYVSPTDYMEKDQHMQEWLEHIDLNLEKLDETFERYDSNRLIEANQKRRSARIFEATCFDTASLRSFLAKWKAFDANLHLSHFFLNQKEQKLHKYSHGETVSEGLEEFLIRALLGQGVVRSSAMILIITASDFNETLLAKAGMLGHQVYIDTLMLGLGCSGIGAFYDEALCSIVEDYAVLYVMAIGNI